MDYPPNYFSISLQRLSDNRTNAFLCHSESFGKLRINSANNLIDSSTYTLEILRLTPQNDVVGRPRQSKFQDQMKSTAVVPVLSPESTGLLPLELDAT